MNLIQTAKRHRYRGRYMASNRVWHIVFLSFLTLIVCGCGRKSTAVPASKLAITNPGQGSSNSTAHDNDAGHDDDLEQREGTPDDTRPGPSEGEVGLVAEFPHHTDSEATGGHRCHCVAWSPDGRLLASGGADGWIVVRDIVADSVVKKWRPTENPIRTLHFSPGQKYLLSDDDTSGVRIWSLVDYQELGSKENAAHAVFLEDEKVLATIRNSGLIGAWSPATTGMPKKIANAGKAVFSLDVDASEDLIASASWDGTVQVRRLSDGELVRQWEILGREVAISTDAANILVGARKDSSVRLLSMQSGNEIWKRPNIACCDAAFMENGRVVVTAGWSDKTPCVAWDVERGRAIHHFSRAKAVGGLAISPNGRFMATASTDGYVRVFRLPDAEQIEASLNDVDAKAQKALEIAKRGGSFNHCMKHLGQAIDLDPGLAEAYNLRAQIKERVGRSQGNRKLLEEAAEDYVMALRWDDKGWQRHFKCAALHSDLGRLEIADEHYRQTIELIRGPENVVPEDWEVRKHLAWSYLNNCDVLIRMNKAKDAMEFGDRAVEVAEAMPMAHLNRGRAYAANRIFDVASKAYERALELAGPRFGNAQIGLANTHFELGELDASFRHQMQAMMVSGVDPGRLWMLAEIELRRGKYENSLRQLAPLAKILKESTNTYLIAGRAWAAAGDLVKAEEQFSKVLKIEPDSPRVQLYLGEIQSRRDEFATAKESYKAALAAWAKAIETQANNPNLRCNRGVFYLRFGRTHEARKDFVAASEMANRHFWSLGNLSITYSASPDAADRDGKKALDLAEKACEITLNRNAWCLSVRAAALAELDRFDDAVKAQNKAIELCASRDIHKYRERLRLYRRNEPFRFPPRGDREPWLALESAVVTPADAPVATFDCLRKGEPVSGLKETDVAKQQDAVVLIQSESGFGTGMIVDQRGYVLTCAHVLPYAGRLKVHFGAAGSKPPGDLVEEAEVIAADHRHDLALLKFDPPKGVKLATVRLGLADEAVAAEKVVIIGNPGVGEFVLAKSVLLGSVSNGRQEIGQFVKRPHLQLSADVTPGCSGGPVFNLNGNVIGVVDQNATVARTGFAIPMDVVAEFLGVPGRQKAE